MKALVYKSTGSWYIVKDDSGRTYNARIKGVLKLDDITSTNPVAVGDYVDVEAESEGNASVVIREILPRNNYINRQSPRNKHQHHIVAANLDQSMLVATLKEPRTSLGFIDRFLVASEMFHVHAIIVFNKSDLHRQKEADKFAGSGVGKTSLLNLLLPDSQLKTGEISGWSGKGQHTTTFAEMYDLPGDGRIIDTPGMKEFGLVDLPKQEVSHYFPEMREKLVNCQFNNCLHVNEPGCAVKEAVMNGEIHEERYASYVTILDSIEERKY
jgi:ribosome biogenesis GTPase